MSDATVLVADTHRRSRSSSRTTPEPHQVRREVTGLLSDGPRKYPVSSLLASSASRGWSAISAELRSTLGWPYYVCQSAEHRNRHRLNWQRRRVRHTNRGRPATANTIGHGDHLVGPTGIGEEEIVVTAPIPRALHLYLPARQFNVLADQYNLPRSPVHSIPYIGGLRDELIRQIGLSIAGEMTRETSTGRMFVETSSLMLAGRSRTTMPIPKASTTSGEVAHGLDNARLRRVLDYIEEHLEEEITVAGLAKSGQPKRIPFHADVYSFDRRPPASVRQPA